MDPVTKYLRCPNIWGGGRRSPLTVRPSKLRGFTLGCSKTAIQAEKARTLPPNEGSAERSPVRHAERARGRLSASRERSAALRATTLRSHSGPRPAPQSRFTPENKSPAPPAPTPATSPRAASLTRTDTSTQARAPTPAHPPELTFPSQTPKVCSQVPGGQPGGFRPRPYTVSPVTHPHRPGTAARSHPPREDALEGAVRASVQEAARRRNPGGV